MSMFLDSLQKGQKTAGMTKLSKGSAKMASGANSFTRMLRSSCLRNTVASCSTLRSSRSTMQISFTSSSSGFVSL